LCQPSGDADAALLLPFRRSVLFDVSPQGHRPRASRRLGEELEGRIRCAVQARPSLPHDPASAAYRLVQPAAAARRIPRLSARLPGPVEPDRRGVRALLADDLPGKHLSAPRTEHLARLPRQPQLTKTYAGAKIPVAAASFGAAAGAGGVANAASFCSTGSTRLAKSRMFFSASACGIPPYENSVTTWSVPVTRCSSAICSMQSSGVRTIWILT